MYLPLRVIDTEDGPLARKASFIAAAHSSVKDALVPRVPDAFRSALCAMPVRAYAAQAGQHTISGACNIENGHIHLQLPQNWSASEADFVTEYQGVLTHEVSHALRGRFSRNETLGDAIVHEGIAIQFGRMLDSSHGTCFSDAEQGINTPRLARMLQVLGPMLRNRQFDYEQIFTQSPVGYTMGEQVVGLYIAGNKKPVGDLLATPSEAFFEYAQRYVQQQRQSQSFSSRYGLR